MPPGTLVSYTVQIASVVDFRAGYDAEHWSELWEEFHCDWREHWFNQRVEPPSWVLADEVLAAGAKGILFASKVGAGGLTPKYHSCTVPTRTPSLYTTMKASLKSFMSRRPGRSASAASRVA